MGTYTYYLLTFKSSKIYLYLPQQVYNCVKMHLSVIPEPTNPHKCMRVYYAHCIPPTCFGHLCGHLQEEVLHRMDISIS